MTLRQWLAEDDFTLTMSSGFFGFFAHTGMISVLEEQELIPKAITGSSSGALVGALWASGISTAEIFELFTAAEKSDFWDPGIGLGLLKGRKFRAMLSDNAPVENLEDCQIPISVSACNGLTRTTRVFSRGPLADAVYASCAVPGLFQPAWIDRRPYWDGGVRDRPGLAAVPDGCRVLYHHLNSRLDKAAAADPAAKHRQRLRLEMIRIADIPKVSPDHLEHGPDAWQFVREETLKWLDQPIGH